MAQAARLVTTIADRDLANTAASHGNRRASCLVSAMEREVVTEVTENAAEEQIADREILAELRELRAELADLRAERAPR